MESRIMIDKKELEERLLKLEKDSFDWRRHPPLCYVPAFPSPDDYICPTCGKKTTQTDFMIHDIQVIRECVGEMQGIGYDVFLNEQEFCVHCGINSKEYIIPSDRYSSNRYESNPELIFGIRFNNDREYHIVRSNMRYDYEQALRFLKGDDSILDVIFNLELFHRTVKRLQKMLGIGLGIPIAEDIMDPEE